jgi:hypothetical protein
MISDYSETVKIYVLQGHVQPAGFVRTAIVIYMAPVLCELPRLIQSALREPNRFKGFAGGTKYHYFL